MPASGGEAQDNTPLLDWDDMANADKYEIKVGLSEEAMTSSAAISVTESQYQIPVELDPVSTVYWVIKVTGTGGQSSGWSSVMSFTITLNFGGTYAGFRCGERDQHVATRSRSVDVVGHRALERRDAELAKRFADSGMFSLFDGAGQIEFRIDGGQRGYPSAHTTGCTLNRYMNTHITSLSRAARLPTVPKRRSPRRDTVP